ncbi:MAG: acetyl-CoA carboxylase, carboxyltransferase subunit beta [Armatimonadota bacterium]
MTTIFNKIKNLGKGKEGELWIKCANCSSLIFKKNFVENFKVCDKCSHHHKLTAWERLDITVNKNSFKELFKDIYSSDPLQFGQEYIDKLDKDIKKTGINDAVLTGEAKIGGFDVFIGIMDFNFRGGSMGSVVGEKIVRLIELAVEKKKPVIIFSASGGAGMQEGMLSLMQMTRTSAAVNKLKEKNILYICVMTDPTTAGVAASFASLGDVILAEPRAIIGFSGARVIEQTIKQKLPPGFQTSEFYLEHGFIDKVISRKQIKPTLIKLMEYFVTPLKKS